MSQTPEPTEDSLRSECRSGFSRDCSNLPASFKVWDLPVRLVHWAIVALVALQWGTAEYDWLSMDWHFRFGYALLGLVVFRVVWGFAGSDSARFASFLRGPRAIWRYVRGGAREHHATHNPIGGWSVLILLGLLFFQAGTGLFANDDDIVVGPLADRVSGSLSEDLTELHEEGKDVLLAFIALHVVAVLWHMLFRKEPLVQAMFSGRKPLPEDPRYRFAKFRTALLIGLVVALAVWSLVVFGSI